MIDSDQEDIVDKDEDILVDEDDWDLGERECGVNDHEDCDSCQ